MSSVTLEIEFKPPQFLIDHFYVAGVIAFVSNTFIGYLLIVKGKKLETFRYFLLSYQVFCAVGDVFLSILMQPIGLFPICAGYSYGLFSFWIPVPVDIQMTILSLLASCQVNTLNICFLRKYRAISDMSNRFRLPILAYKVAVTLLGSYPVLFSAAFFLSGIPKEEQFSIIRNDYPSLEQQFRSLPDFQLYIMNFWMSAYFFLAMFGCIQSGVTIGVSVLQMIRTLHEVKSLISKSTWNKHKVAVRNLVIQFQVTLVGILPAVSIAFVVLIPTKHSQGIVISVTYMLSVHSDILLPHNDRYVALDLQRGSHVANLSGTSETCRVLDQEGKYNIECQRHPEFIKQSTIDLMKILYLTLAAAVFKIYEDWKVFDS